MLKKIKNMDPMTKQFAVACAIHIATVASLCATALIVSARSKNAKN